MTQVKTIASAPPDASPLSAAVSAMVRADLARTEEERSEVLQEWKETKKQAAKDERQFWLFWFVVIAALGLYFNYFR